MFDNDTGEFNKITAIGTIQNKSQGGYQLQEKQRAIQKEEP